MTIIRAAQHEDFTVLPNAALRDRRLSWKARGLLVHLLSMPPLWRTSAERLARLAPDGRDSVRSGLAELRRVGYIVTERRQDTVSGRWTTVNLVHDRPVDKPVDRPVDDLGTTTPTEDGLSDVGKAADLVSTEPVNTYPLEQTVPRNCSDCHGTGWTNLANQVERCPRCEVLR